MTKNKTIRRFFSRAAMMLLMMMLTTVTAWAWSGKGNEGSPYQISTVADLIQLANDVNSGTTYEGFFFKLMNNIDFNDNASLKPTKAWDDDTSTEQNFPGIGGYNTADRTFDGTFNGNNKTISGIRIYSGGKGNSDEKKGLFGRIGSGGTVKNLTLSNARITGYTRTGGIAGRNFGKIDSCHVTNTVCIHTFISGVNDYHGGVAGENSNSTGIITNCTSSAKLTVEEGVTAGYGYGGIVGYNSTYGKLRNNFVSGATIPAAMGNFHGAIAGRNKDGTMKNNYYTGCTVAGTENASNVGCMGADVTTDDGAIGIGVLALGTNVTASGSTKEYNSTTYYYGTVTLGYSGTVPTGGIVKYAVNGDYISGNKFTISCDANVTAVVVCPYADISVLTYHGSTFDILGNTYFTSGSYYEINDEQDLIDLAEYIRGGSDRYCEGLTFKMTADLDFTAMPLNCHDKDGYGTGNFVPIGIDNDHGGSVFKGHFDGQGHTITGLSFSYPYNYIGLFRNIVSTNASVENVTLVNPNFSSHNVVGGIVGILVAGTISNCKVVGGSVTASNEAVGGIVGQCIYNTSTDVKTITGCTVIGTTVSGSSYVGAIVGENTGSTSANNALTISNCTYDATTNENIVGYGYGTMFTDGGGNKMVYQVNLGENVTASGATYSSALLPGKAYYASGANVTLGHTDRTGYDFSNYSVNGTAIDGSTFTMPASNVTVSATWTPDPVHFADNGDGTYTIKTAAGWGVFCDALQDNTTYNGFSGKTVKLGNNIGTAQDPITRMAGSQYHDFCGTFDGQGHTLNVNLNGAQYVAPFFYVKSQDNDHPATIQNLKVSGTFTGSDKFAAGIAGGCANVVNITNCLVDVTINSSVNGDGTHGGLVGVFDGGTLNITGCAFTGKLLSIGSGATTKCGGFVGYSHGNGTAVNITNSLYAPAALVGSETEPTSESKTFLRSTNTTVTITNSYYTRTLGDAQGTTPYIYTTKPTGIGTEGTMYNVSGITAYTNGINQNGKYYTTPPDPAHFAQDGDEYTIKSATGWDVFCDLLGESETFSGKTVKLGDNISVTRMAGSNNHRFAGTFDGQGNTLTVSYEDTGDYTMTAPFSYVDGATIRNLVVGGSITDTGYRAAGIIGETSENLSHITNCVSSVNISGNRYTAGFSIGGNVAIEGCVFNGKIVGTQYSGGFVGWSYNGLAITNCLFAPQDGSSISGGTFYYNGGGGAPTPTNSYYTTALGTTQGKQAHSITAGENVTVTNAGTPETVYSVSGITSYGTGIKYGSNLYAGSGDEVSLTLSHGDREGYTFDGYTASAGTLSGDANPYTLTMPDEDVVINGLWEQQGVTLTIGSSGWATWYDTKSYTLSEGAQAYYVSSIGEGVVNLTAIDGVPTGLPVLISGTPGKSVTLAETATAVEVTGNDPQFKGTATGLSATDFTDFAFGRTYVLYGGAFLLVDENSGIPKNKCWLTLSSNGARQMRISIDDATAMYDVPCTMYNSDDAWYDLRGRKLSGEPTRKGVYIYKGGNGLYGRKRTK